MLNRKLTSIFVALLWMWMQSCGTGFGNPGSLRSPASPNPSGFNSPIDLDYPPFECGEFSEESSEEEIESGRNCIREALENCEEKDYYILFFNEDNTYFESVVSVYQTSEDLNECEVYIQLQSNDPNLFDGYRQATCETLSESENPEFSCGILE